MDLTQAEETPDPSSTEPVAAEHVLDRDRIRLEPWQSWLLLVLVLLFLYGARNIVGPFVIAGVIAYVFTGGVTAVTNRLGWPRLLVATLLYILALGIIGVLIYFGASALVKETADLSSQGPNLLESAITQLFGAGKVEIFGQQLDPHTIATQ